MNLNTRKILLLFVFVSLGMFNFSAHVPDEGMFPLSDINRAGLKKAGLKINEKDIYDPGNVGLVDALVRVGGCSGSFVSPNGLIITNHHCAFSAVQLASSAQNNYLENGFVAQSYEQEIEARGLTIRITDSYEDVSQQILSAVEHIKDPSERIEVINQKRKQLALEAEAKDPTIKAEVSEMFIGKSYVLFRYKTIEDVRLVYIPRQDIGEFGGESDNWVWPRHTGDFSFLRAYVAPDGSSAKYSKDNVPYKPKKHLKVNPQGVDVNDFVFILGYPGRTFRHRPAQYIEYQEKFLLPYVSELNHFQNEQMKRAGENDTDIAIQLATRIKRNANVMKNYQGKIKGLRNIALVDKKKKEDQELSDFIESDKNLKAKYGTLMQEIDQHYQLVFSDAYKEMWMNNIYRSSNLLRAATYLNSFKNIFKGKNGIEQKKLFEENIEKVKEQIANIYEDYNVDVDINILGHMFDQGYDLKEKNTIQSLSSLSIPSHVECTPLIKEAVMDSKLKDQASVYDHILSSPENLLSYTDEIFKFASSLNEEYAAFQAEEKRREGSLNKLMGDYVAVKELFQGRSFVPDANSTLRLTFGNIKGYSPVDATYMNPISTIKGIIEKGYSDNPEYQYPKSIREAWEARNFGPYIKEDLNDVPVNILYNMDTTGGNSGSPIMNAYGELIGVNFDRAYDATINDFAWDESYSRSIGVDIRFVLWVADKIDNAQFILREMGI